MKFFDALAITIGALMLMGIIAKAMHGQGMF